MSRRKLSSAAATVLLALSMGAIFAVSGQGEGLARHIERGIPYGEDGGPRLLLDVYYPRTGGVRARSERKPAIILIHGGGWERGSKEGMAQYALALAGRGFTCFAVNYRLTADPRNVYPAQIDDVRRALRWIRANAARFGVDPGRIGALGESAGAYLAAFLGMGEGAGGVRCVVDISGPMDLTVRYPDFPYNAENMVEKMLGASREESPERYRDASPIFHVNPKAPPFLIVHGAGDRLVREEQARRFYTALKEAGVEAELLVFRDEAHGVRKFRNRNILERSAVRFLRKHLMPGGKTPGPAPK